jgi:hypothetical protein
VVMASSYAQESVTGASQFEAFRDFIEELVLLQGLADKAIIIILNNRGFKISIRSLQRRLNT